jgi:hypothetical protein
MADIFYGLELVKKGMVWWIGTGSMVKIFRDNWLPCSGALKVEGKRRPSRLKWFSNLIDHESRSWKEEVVRECCWPHDANSILGIKLAARAYNDFMAWSGENNGLFSVRSNPSHWHARTT